MECRSRESGVGVFSASPVRLRFNVARSQLSNHEFNCLASVERMSGSTYQHGRTRATSQVLLR